MLSEQPTVGVVLMNLGSPDSPSVKDVRVYLKEFLMDERVIDVPRWLRTILVKGIIVPFRSPKSAHAYSSIWTENGSPLIYISEQLKQLVANTTHLPVELAMRYGNPTPHHSIKQLLKTSPNIQKIILVPLYPHYAMSSYETAVEYFKAAFQALNPTCKLHIVPPYFEDANYIAALSKSIEPYLTKDFDKLILSYHGIPERHIYKSDCTGNHCLTRANCCQVPSAAHEFCYRHQTYQTTTLLIQSLNLPSEKVEQTFQSRLGRDQWLKPYTAERLKELPKEGVKKLMIACPAFVSDCLETLEEIAEEGKQIFMEAGGEEYTVIPCLNTHSSWVNTIHSFINKAIQDS